MGQVSTRLRRAVGGYGHYCPGCDELHVIPDSWAFNNDLERPTFSPSVLTQGMRHNHDGDFLYDEKGKPIPYRCHYHLREGKLQYCADCNHKLANQTVDLPVLPDWLWDDIVFREAT